MSGCGADCAGVVAQARVCTSHRAHFVRGCGRSACSHVYVGACVGHCAVWHHMCGVEEKGKGVRMHEAMEDVGVRMDLCSSGVCHPNWCVLLWCVRAAEHTNTHVSVSMGSCSARMYPYVGPRCVVGEYKGDNKLWRFGVHEFCMHVHTDTPSPSVSQASCVALRASRVTCKCMGVCGGVQRYVGMRG